MIGGYVRVPALLFLRNLQLGFDGVASPRSSVALVNFALVLILPNLYIIELCYHITTKKMFDGA
jgi:hypothetical protein